jgi:hypothetical protein
MSEMQQPAAEKKQVIFSPSVSGGIALEYLKSTLANLS